MSIKVKIIYSRKFKYKDESFVRGEKMKQFIVDAFTDKVFRGNPAAVCILDEWLPDELMLNITRENNLSETAFAVKVEDKYHLRWFTPKSEIDLCGHATLATSYVIFNYYCKDKMSITFTTLSGDLTVNRKNELYEMIFPVFNYKNVEVTDEMTEALGVRPVEAILSRDLVMILDSEDEVINLKPDFNKLIQLDGLIQGVTAKSKMYDCTSRIFAPKCKIKEDPVTGSTHCMIVPYWSEKLGKNKLIAHQSSERSGILYCELADSQVKIAGKAVLFATSYILPTFQ